MLEKILESQVFVDMLILVLTATSGYLLTYINKKKQELQIKIDNEIVNKYMDMLEATVVDCVAATNQTYVEALKKKGAFTAEAQKAAFAMTFNNIMAILSEDCLEYLGQVVVDVDKYITNKIEAEVNFAK